MLLKRFLRGKVVAFPHSLTLCDCYLPALFISRGIIQHRGWGVAWFLVYGFRPLLLQLLSTVNRRLATDDSKLSSCIDFSLAYLYIGDRRLLLSTFYGRTQLLYDIHIIGCQEIK